MSCNYFQHLIGTRQVDTTQHVSIWHHTYRAESESTRLVDEILVLKGVKKVWSAVHHRISNRLTP